MLVLKAVASLLQAVEPGLSRMLRDGRSAVLAGFGIGAGAPTGQCIAVHGWSAQEISAIVQECSRLCRGQKRAGFFCEVLPRFDGVFHLRLAADIDPQCFLLLLNALNCPLDHALQGRKVAVLGSVILTAGFAAPQPALLGQSAWIYLPAGDSDYDVVHVGLPSGAAYRCDFAAGLWETVDDARMPPAARALCPGLEPQHRLQALPAGFHT